MKIYIHRFIVNILVKYFPKTFERYFNDYYFASFEKSEIKYAAPDEMPYEDWLYSQAVQFEKESQK